MYLKFLPKSITHFSMLQYLLKHPSQDPILYFFYIVYTMYFKYFTFCISIIYHMAGFPTVNKDYIVRLKT